MDIKSYIIILLLMVGFTSCTEEEPHCIEVEGNALFIQERYKAYTDNVEKTTIEDTRTDTFLFDIKLSSGRYSSGITKGKYAIEHDTIRFTEIKDLCPPTADCLFPISNRAFAFECSENMIKLSPYIPKGRVSYSGSRYTITYETISQSIIINR